MWKSLFIASLVLLTPSLALSQTAPIIEPSGDILARGTSIVLNGRTFPIPWIQWRSGDTIRFGVPDTLARQLFGFDILSTNDVKSQGINWFNSQTLTTKFINPYRYLDISDLVGMLGVNPSVTGGNLVLNPPVARLRNLTLEKYGSVSRIIIELDRPVPWQIVRNKNGAEIILESNADSNLLSRFRSLPVNNKPDNNDEDDLGGGGNDTATRIVSLSNRNTTTRLNLSLPAGYGLQVTSVNNPPRIVIDSRPDPMDEKRVTWQEGVIWNQKYIQIGSGWFPVTWLEIDSKNPNINLRPIVPDNSKIKGTSPLVSIHGSNRAVASINGGFFNRNNQLPLGAIKVDGRWLSGPILNRGAIAWDNRGNIGIDRLRLQETLTTRDGRTIELKHLNSGYVERGIGRYTREWGTIYNPVVERERVITVVNDRITGILNDRSPKDSIPIPADGYLLVVRNSDFNLPVGTELTLNVRTSPADFNNYPNIIAAGPLLLRDGRVVLDGELEKFSKAFQEQRASRSAIAINRDRKILIVAIHNRIGGRGPTLAEFALLLQNLGAVSALNLDGGSSTGIVLGGEMIDRSPVTAARVHNGVGIFILSPSP